MGQTLGDIIKRYREEHQMSMDSFSEKSGLSKGYISMLEKNEHPNTKKPIKPTLGTIKQAALAMNLDFNDLINALDDDYEVTMQPLKKADPEEETIHTIAAHAIGELTDEDIEEIIRLAKHLKSKYKD